MPVGADLAGHPGDLVGERRQLVDHRVDRRLQLQDLAPGVHGDLLRQVAPRHRRGDLGDAAHLRGQVGGHEFTASVRSFQVPATSGHRGLAAQQAVGAHLAGHPGDLVGEQAQRGGQRVDRVGQLGDLAAGVHGDRARQVALRDRGGRVGDGAHLVGEVGRHGVHRVGERPPGARHAAHVGLAARAARRCPPRGPRG